MFAFLRPALPPRLYRADQNPIVYENGRSSLEFRPKGSDFALRTVNPPIDGDTSIMVPPFHYHIYQAEHFRISSGSVNLYAFTDAQPWKVLSDAPGAEKTAMIPKKTYHRLENASTTDPLVLDVHLSPETYDEEQRFFRNFFGYLDDCKRTKQAPSFFQLMVFLYYADTPFALPISPHWLGIIVSRVFQVAIAGWGRWILGYHTTYSEYYEEKKDI